MTFETTDTAIVILKTLVGILKYGVPFCLLIFFACRYKEKSPDKKILERLRKEGVLLAQSHELRFILSFATQELAAQAAKDFEGQDFKSNYLERSQGSESDWLLLLTRLMVPEHTELKKLREKFNALASWYGGIYEGWDIQEEG